MSELLRRLGALYRRGRLDRELEEEMRIHLEMHAEENGGLEAARRQFGNVTRLQEASREMWGWPALERLAQDVRYAVRMLRKNAGFSAVVVLVLALGIGGGTTVFSILNALVLNPFPYPNADRLVEIQVRTDGDWNTSLPIGDFFDWRSQNSVFEEMATYGYSRYNVSGPREPEVIVGGATTAGFLRVLGVQPALGRFFTPAEDVPNGPPVAVLSYGMWKRQFGGRGDVLGQKVIINGRPRVVIGVTPARLPLPGIFTCEFWIPAGYDPAIGRGTWRTMDNPIARLKPGVSLAEAQANLSLIAHRLELQYPETNRGRRVRAVPIGREFTQSARDFLYSPLAAVGLVLILACTNLAGLLLARGAARAKEMAMRASLGAGRGRLIRQMLTEAVLLSLCGGALGLLVASWGIGAVAGAAPPHMGLDSALRIDGPVLGFTLAVSALTGIFFGLVPALYGSRPDLNALLKGSASAPAGRPRNRLLSGLVVAEVALALVLLIGGGLLAKSFVRLLQVDVGVKTDHLLTFQLGLSSDKYSSASRRAEVFEALVPRLRLIPGVQAASAVSALPMSGEYNGNGFQIDGRPIPKNWRDMAAQYLRAAPGYFRTMSIPVLVGREFDERDQTGVTKVVIINQRLAQRFFPGEKPLGQRINHAQIVGVVGNIRHDGPAGDIGPQIYSPLVSSSAAYLVLRTMSDPLRLAQAVRSEVRALDREVPLYRLRSMEQVVSDSVADTHMITSILGGFSLFALALAAIGIFGVVSYAVNQRTHEIGVRVALGASPTAILAMALSKGVVLAGLGLLIGVPAALAGSRLLRSLLFGVSPRDATVFTAVPLVLLLVALAASYLPARRAAKVDPVEALRQE